MHMVIHFLQIRVKLLTTLLRIMVEVFMQHLQLLNWLDHTSTLTQTQQTLVEVECIYSRVLNLKKDHEYQQYHVRLMINNNSAQYGGGIVVADDTQRSACRGGATETDATQCWLASLNCIHGTRRIYNISTHSWLTTWLPCQEQTSTEVCWTGVQ